VLQRLGIQTSVLEEKTTATKMLGCYAAQLRGGFYPYAKATADVFIPTISQRIFEGGLPQGVVGEETWLAWLY